MYYFVWQRYMARQEMLVILALFVMSLKFRNLATQQCGIDHYALYQKMLKDHTFKIFKTRPLSLDCKEACKSDIRCQSYNYVMLEDICELNNRTKEARPGDFVKDVDRYYMEKKPKGTIEPHYHSTLYSDHGKCPFNGVSLLMYGLSGGTKLNQYKTNMYQSVNCFSTHPTHEARSQHQASTKKMYSIRKDDLVRLQNTAYISHGLCKIMRSFDWAYITAGLVISDGDIKLSYIPEAGRETAVKLFIKSCY